MKKRGISGVVAAILLILLVIAAIIIFWYAARQIISQDSDVGLITSDFKIESASSFEGGYNVRVKRNPGYGNVVKLKLVFVNDAGERYTYNYTNPIKQLEIKTIQTGAIDFPDAVKVELYPVILSEKGNELLGPKKDEFWIISCESDIDCDNGAYCNGQETCNLMSGNCVAGTAVDCSGNNLVEIATCNYDPDNNPFTWDYRAAFTSSCDEATDSCITGSVSLTHNLIIGICGVECIQDSDCADPTPICNTYTCVPAGIFVSEDGTIRYEDGNYFRNTGGDLNVEWMSIPYRTYIEFDIGSINNPAITRVDLRLNVRQILSGVCPIYSLENQPSDLANSDANNQIIFNDISDGNPYLDNSFCTTPGEQIIILGPQAVSDLQGRVNSGAGWFGVGIYTNAADRAIIDSSESANGPALIVS